MGLSTKRNFAAITSRRFRQQQNNSEKIRIKPKCRGDILADKQMLEKFVKGQIDFWTEHNPFEDFEAPYFPKSVCEAKISTKKIIGKQEQQNKRSKPSSGQKYKLASNLSSRGIEHETCICYAGHFRQPNIMDRAKKTRAEFGLFKSKGKKIKCVS